MRKPPQQIVTVDLSHFAQVYGIIDFDKTLAQVLKGFVDMGQYPEGVKDHETMAREVAQCLDANGYMVALTCEEHRYTLNIAKPEPQETIAWEAGGGRPVILPMPVWWLFVDEVAI